MTRRLPLTLLAGAAIAFATTSGHAAEIAASIQYDFAQPPAGLSAVSSRERGFPCGSSRSRPSMDFK
jgi:hypothetical protein